MSKESRNPKATCKIGGEAGSVHMVTIGAAINSFPWVAVKFHKNKGGNAAKVLSSELISSLAGFQQKMFTARTEPDLELQIDDGNEGKLTFKGYIANPGLNASYGDISADIKAIHPASVMEALNMSIYTAPGTATNLKTGNPKDPAWSKRLSDITTALVEKWQKSSKSGGGDDVAIRQEIHAQNEKPLEVWKAILSASNETTLQKSMKAASDHAGVNRSINSFLANTLLSVKPSFMGTALALNASLQMLYAPGMEEADYGKFVLTQNLFKDPETLTAVMNENGCEAGLGARSNLPLGQVLVMGLGGSNFMDKLNANTGERSAPPTLKPKIVVKYPETGITGGQIISVPLPPFLPFPISLSPYQTSGPVTRTQKASETVKEMMSASDSLGSYIKGSLSEVCKDYAHNIYVDLAISGAQFTINLPLDLKVKVGSYYNVKGPEADLFRGLLVQATHSLTISESDASANSRLTFAYVEMNGFSLPNK